MSQITENVTPGGVERLRDRFRGALLGVAVGDALGAPLEFQPARDPEHYVTEMIGGGWLRLAPGAYTDDTQLTLATVDSLLTRRVFDPDDIARRFVVWYQSSPPDIGNHTRTVLAAIANGMDWEQASRQVQQANPDNAPNGSIMRCAPLALFLYGSPEPLAMLTPVLSRITHAHPDCEDACVFLNVMIAECLTGATKERALEAASSLLGSASDALRARIRRAGELRNTTSPSGWVLDTLEVALWAFLYTSNFESALVAAINRGDDADTVGAVLGGLAGAYYGWTAIPERWRNSVQDGPKIADDADRLLALAQS